MTPTPEIPPEITSDVWTLGDLVWHGVLGFGGIFMALTVGLVKKAAGDISRLDKESVENKKDISYLKEGQDELKVDMKTAVKTLTIIKTIVDSRKNTSITNAYRRRGED